MTSKRSESLTRFGSATILVLVGIICFPLTCFILCTGGFAPCGNIRIQKAQRKEMARAQKRRRKDLPRPLEEKRKREVSLGPTGRRKKMTGRFSSRRNMEFMPPTLLQLPSEILEMILLEVLGGQILHIIQCQRRLGHISCKESHSIDHATYFQYDLERACIPSHQRRKFMAHEWMRWRYHNESPPIPFYMPSDSCFAILRTCRQLYNQGISILYSRNIFDINNPETLLYLSQTIIPARFNTIKHLQIDVNTSMFAVENPIEIPSNAFGLSLHPGLEKILEIVAGMKGLETLRVRMALDLVEYSLELSPGGDDRFKMYLDEILEAVWLSRVRGLKRFDLETCSPNPEVVEQSVEWVRELVCA